MTQELVKLGVLEGSSLEHLEIVNGLFALLGRLSCPSGQAERKGERGQGQPEAQLLVHQLQQVLAALLDGSSDWRELVSASLSRLLDEAFTTLEALFQGVASFSFFPPLFCSHSLTHNICFLTL